MNIRKNENLTKESVTELLYNLKQIGLKTVEWTGGGDPLLWKHLYDAVGFAEDIGLEQGLITNGIKLNDFDESFFACLSWVRVSMNCLDYLDSFDIPDMPHSVLGFSYVMNQNTSVDVLGRLKLYTEKHKPKYVRIVPNCQSTKEEQEKNNRIFGGMVRSWGEPYFYQYKNFDAPNDCWWCYLKPFVLHDHYVYPCSSVVLNDEAGRSFHDKYRWCRMEDLPDKYENEMIPFPTDNCSHCVFKPQNEIVDMLINPTGMEMFV